MQDRFKFRCWDKENKCMYYPTRYSNFNIVNGVIVKIESYLTGNGVYRGKRVAYEFDDAILMQSTGLKDKNGKLIYEGDIISFDCTYRNKITNYKFAIVFFNGCFGVFTETNFEPLTQFLDYHCENEKTVYDDCYAEVIGSIYKNPELLED